MRFNKMILVLALLMFALVGCRQQPAEDTAALQIELDTSAASMAVGETTLVIVLKDGNNAPVNDAKLAVRGDMNHAGMVPVLRDVEGGQDGRYEVPFEWTMGGDWIVDVTATLPNDTVSTATFNLTVSSDGTEDHSQHDAHGDHDAEHSEEGESHEGHDAEESHEDHSDHAEDAG
jgi:hypothetical protein